MMWDNPNGYDDRDQRRAPTLRMPSPSLPIAIPPGSAPSAQFTSASFPQTGGGYPPPSPSYNYPPTYQGNGYAVYQPQLQWPQMQSYQAQVGQPLAMQQQPNIEQYTRSRKHSHSNSHTHSRSRSHSHSRTRSHSHSHSHSHTPSSRHRTHSHSHSHSQPQPQYIIARQPSPNPYPVLRPSHSYSQLPQIATSSISHHRPSHSYSHSQPQVLIANPSNSHGQQVLHASHSFSHLPQAGAPRPIVFTQSAPAKQQVFPRNKVPPKKYTTPKLKKIGQTHHLNVPFQYSNCTGRKKALCIGINYLGQQNELRGCINDARHVRDFLINQWGYRAGDIVILTDDSQNKRQQPTRKNILDAMHWLVRSAKCHDSLFFHYSGHGGQTKDLNGDELDGYDEVIYPVDFKEKGHIKDDDMHSIMVKPLPSGCRLTGLFDSCHSGTILDLPYIYSSHGRLKGSQITDSVRELLKTPADVISLSACKDNQTSVDTFHGGVAVGAMSWAFIHALTNNPHQSYDELLRSLRKILAPKFDQTPQLGSSHRIDTRLDFKM